MLSDFAWNAFQITGIPDMYVFYKEVTNLKKKEEEIESESTGEPTLQG